MIISRLLPSSFVRTTLLAFIIVTTTVSAAAAIINPQQQQNHHLNPRSLLLLECDEVFLYVKAANSTMYLETPDGMEVVVDDVVDDIPLDDVIKFSDYNGTLKFGRTYCFSIEIADNSTIISLHGSDDVDSTTALSLPGNDCGCGSIDKGPIVFTLEPGMVDRRFGNNELYLKGSNQWNVIPLPVEEEEDDLPSSDGGMMVSLYLHSNLMVVVALVFIIFP